MKQEHRNTGTRLQECSKSYKGDILNENKTRAGSGFESHNG